MKRVRSFLKAHHGTFTTEFHIHPFISLSLLLIYTAISGSFGYLLGMDLFAETRLSSGLIFEILMLRMGILALYLMLNLLFLYLMIGYFRKSFIPLTVLLSYYAAFSTAVFVLTNLMFLIVVIINYVFNIDESPLFIVFGISLLIVFTLLNLYPAYLFYLAIRSRPIDIFWPLILHIFGIHVITYTMFQLWNSVDILMMWNSR